MQFLPKHKQFHDIHTMILRGNCQSTSQMKEVWQLYRCVRLYVRLCVYKNASVCLYVVLRLLACLCTCV